MNGSYYCNLTGYADDRGGCDGNLGSKGVGIEGTGAQTTEVQEAEQCCEQAAEAKAKGWTFVPNHQESQQTQAASVEDAEEIEDVTGECGHPWLVLLAGREGSTTAWGRGCAPGLGPAVPVRADLDMPAAELWVHV